MNAEMPDNELIALYRGGKADAFDLIYERYKPTIKRISRSYFLFGGDSDDLSQEALLGLLKAADTYEEGQGAAFKTYANICISSRVKTAIRLSNSKGAALLNGATDIEKENLASSDPEDLVIGKEGGREIMNLIEKTLSKFEFSVLTAYLEGLNHKEISERVGKSEKAIDNALQRARKKIRRAINK